LLPPNAAAQPQPPLRKPLVQEKHVVLAGRDDEDACPWIGFGDLGDQPVDVYVGRIITAYFRPAVPLRVQAFVAAMITPPYAETHGTFRDLHEELQAAETMTNLEHRQRELDRLRAKTVRLALAVLEDKPLPRKSRPKRSQATALQDGDAAETGEVDQSPAAGIQDLLDALKRPF
jgi:hypothetical protein